jgi:hypothetical protein
LPFGVELRTLGDVELGRRGRVRPSWRAAAVVAAALTSCSSPEEASPLAQDEAVSAAPITPEPSPCVLEDEPASPPTVLDVIDRVNQQPRPLTLPCFIESLARPLELNATESLISAQPAVGRRSPRLFIFVDPLIMSISFDGVGRHLLELGEVQPGGTRALKAEIAFPVTEELSRAAPFERVLFRENLTSCGACHQDEELATDVTFTRAFVSRALRPLPRERVALDALALEVSACDPAREPERCALLDAVFGGGPVVEREFPATMSTFY